MNSAQITAVQKTTHQQLKLFYDYDDGLTCVACWYYMFRDLSVYQPFTRHFEWFPQIKQEDLLKTPDFTVLLTKGGIIGEVKANMPQDDTAFDKELEQIASYDSISCLPDVRNEFCQVADIDKILLVRDTCAAEVTQRIIDKFHSDEHWFQMRKPPIVMEYFYSQDYGDTRFVIRRVQHEGNGVFSRMQTNPPEKDLYWHLCEKKRPIRLPPSAWVTTKTKYMVMNDTPPPIFCAVLLWGYLMQWSVRDRGYSPSTTRNRSYELKVSITEIASQIRSDVFFNQTLQVTWIRMGLDYLKTCGLAENEKANRDIYTIRLQPLIGGRVANKDDIGELRDVAKELAERYARSQINKSKIQKPSQAANGNLILPFDQ